MKLRRLITPIVSLSIFFCVWEIFYWLIINNPFLLAPPSKVLMTLIELVTVGKPPRFFMPLDILYSLFHYAIGFSLAIVVGFTVGLIAGWSKLANRLSYPIIELVRPIPPIAWIPIAILMLKLTHTAAGFIIFIGAVFPILLNTRHGVASVEVKYLEAAMTLGAIKSLTLIRKVVIQAALPSILTGIRIGSGIAWMCVVAAELFGVAPYGLGYQIEIARFYHSPDIIIAYMLMIGILGLLLDRMYGAIENRVLAWRAGLVIA
ncbi:MAG: ABC transporter permease [Candidatus Nezhaarchaeota archaeon]|nr:ABC transporter permease [Candidatus Nezhaarchaeota archaeon]MCX8142382.1 ABC transporter permease [Candidatus Nezhaarchaeota archaeon]MDW8050645.1 ABC transporter permease [Nitrososphaerota archaeon]